MCDDENRNHKFLNNFHLAPTMVALVGINFPDLLPRCYDYMPISKKRIPSTPCTE